MCSGRVGSSYSTNDTRRVVNNPMLSHVRYENALLQIEKHEANIKDLKLENNHLHSSKQRAENQVSH